ncbi:hypothetical protein G5B37_09025 [Rasiella rasia]|uniref:Uncharacterized protein n=1 Tax=Rasiella rasia TaxID=2744027 RepID=A0A6G6GMI2_9FLAO|nr:DUF6503 family protein [Rasiella rasia]QIE59700.1 hypothetical protein G5B37_09025 [Rasiella rasia]
MKFYIVLFILLTATAKGVFAQKLTASQVLERAIAYHDPSNNWETFNDTFQVTMTTENNADRVSNITINLPKEYFSVTATRDGVETFFTLDKEKCTTSSKDSVTDKGARTPCETATLYKNYYTYLYGLPMKLKDPGTNLSPKVERVTFKGKEYLKLKATYDEAVGSDVWFFYFNPKTYAMEVYQFFKGDPTGAGKDTGEYILLSEESTVGGIIMPKIRAWYYNKEDKYLGSDTITN